MREWVRLFVGLVFAATVVLLAGRAEAYPGTENVNGGAINFWPTSGAFSSSPTDGCAYCHGDSDSNFASPAITLTAGSGVSGSGTTFNVFAGSLNNAITVSFPDSQSCSGQTACRSNPPSSYGSSCTLCAAGGFLVKHADTSPNDTTMGTLKESNDGWTHSCKGPAAGGCSDETENDAREVSHLNPFSSASPSFRFLYDAPSACGSFSFIVWANATNGDSSCGATDNVANKTFTINVNCPAAPVDSICSTPVCSGGSCVYFGTGATCRGAADECDAVETCSGTSCPGDGKKGNGTGCGDDGNPCTTDTCNGSSDACQHSPGNAGMTCRNATSGGCDQPEKCTGSSATCPTDGFTAANTQCRAANGACDVAEKCDGLSANCPVDVYQPASFQCSPPSCATVGGTDFQTPASFCPGNAPGACPAVSAQSCGGALCSGNACAGSCADDSTCATGNYCSASTCVPKKSSGTCTANNQCLTGNCVDGVCCDKPCAGGTADCQACNLTGSVGTCTLIAKNTTCRASLGGCDPAEACDGASSACPADAKRPNGFVCRAAGGNTCDVDETCDGTSVNCPADKKQPAGTLCRAVAGECDVAELCDGTNAACPTDKFIAATTVCRGVNGDCDVAENCPGNAAKCPADKFALVSVQCRAASCQNDIATKAEHCTGSSGTCPGVQTTACSPFTCAATNCFGGTCTADAQCDANDYCEPMTQSCVPKKSVGSQCSNSGECQGSAGSNGHCVDGYCCDSTCTGQCEACNVPSKLGTCSAVSGDPIGARPTCQSDGSKCGGTCDGKLRNRCTYPSSGTSCRDAGCTSGVATEGAFCDGRGACPPAFTETCTGACSGTGCGNDCSVDADCPLDSFCATGVCLKKRSNGGTCPSDSACTSGTCVDGYCCNSSCTGQCEACDVAGNEGKCSPVAAKDSPHGARSGCTSDGTACGGSCDGTTRNACAYPTGTASCRPASCSGGVATLEGFCTGDGRCPATQEVTCSPASCNSAGTRCNGGCATNADCKTTEWCAAGKCVLLLSPGAACSADAQCTPLVDTKGHCVDGVCCNRACTGQCEACDIPTLEGTCTTVPYGFPHGGRAACVGSGACGGACLGTSATDCGLPGAETACGTGSCIAGVATDAAVCNGTGSCLTAGTRTCAPYACNATGCNTTCTSGADCATGFDCTDGACGVPVSSGGSSAGGNAGASGAAGNGGASAMSGTGGDSAGTVGEAGAPSADGGVDAPVPVKDKGSCGCRVPGGSEGPSGSALLAALALAVGALRRRSRRAA